MMMFFFVVLLFFMLTKEGVYWEGVFDATIDMTVNKLARLPRTFARESLSQAYW